MKRFCGTNTYSQVKWQQSAHNSKRPLVYICTWAHYIHTSSTYISGQNTYIPNARRWCWVEIKSSAAMLQRGALAAASCACPIVFASCNCLDDKVGPSIRIYLCKIEWSVRLRGSRISSRNEKPLHSPINMIISK